MINISTERTSKDVEVTAKFHVNGSAAECIEEFAAVIESLKRADEKFYLLASLAETQRAIEEREHGDEE